MMLHESHVFAAANAAASHGLYTMCSVNVACDHGFVGSIDRAQTSLRQCCVDHSLQRFRIRCSQMHVATDMPYVTQIISSLTVHGVEVARETSSEIATDRSGFSRPPRTPGRFSTKYLSQRWSRTSSRDTCRYIRHRMPAVAECPEDGGAAVADRPDG
jgi:hypothetical protein